MPPYWVVVCVQVLPLGKTRRPGAAFLIRPRLEGEVVTGVNRPGPSSRHKIVLRRIPRADPAS